MQEPQAVQRARIDRIAIAYRDLGEGRPVVLLAPGPGLDSNVFFPWLEPLADAHRLIAVDYRGHGRSDAGPPDSWTVPRFAADIVALAQTLELSDWVLLGHSFGGRLGMYVASRRPASLAGLVVSCAFATKATLARAEARLEELEPPEIRQQVTASFDAEDAGLVNTPDEARRMWADQMPFFCADPVGQAVQEIVRRWAGVTYSPEVADGIDPREIRDQRAQLATIEVPTLVVTGRDDRIADVEASEEIAGLIAEARLEVVDGAGHFPYAERPDGYIKVVRAFLDAL
jgi:pimeloyl-ACP methyl ester carboxylesterase